VREVGNGENFIANLAGKFPNFLMRALEELVEDPQLVHDFKSGRMDGIAAEVAQKVCMFLKYDNIHTHASEQETQHDARRPTSSNTTASLNGFGQGGHLTICQPQISKGGWDATGQKHERDAMPQFENTKGKGRDFGYALAVSSCEGA
jgi:hypothetical protein